MYEVPPTINEIIYNRQATPPGKDFRAAFEAAAFHVGDLVKFFFGSVIRTGRITNALRHGLSYVYHIETSIHTWYRGIEEDSIISKINQ